MANILKTIIENDKGELRKLEKMIRKLWKIWRNNRSRLKPEKAI